MSHLRNGSFLMAEIVLVVHDDERGSSRVRLRPAYFLLCSYWMFL